MSTQIGSIEAVYGRRTVSYQLELIHTGLNKHRLLRGPDRGVLQSKARLQALEWDQQWQARRARDSATLVRARAARDRQAQKEYVDLRKQEAAELSVEAKAALNQLRGTLAHTLDHDDAIQWRALKTADPFIESKPRPRPVPGRPAPTPVPNLPSASAPEFQPQLGVLDYIIPSRKAARVAEATARLQTGMAQWEAEKADAARADATALERWEAMVIAMRAEDDAAARAWEESRQAHEAAVALRHASVDAFRARYEAKEPDAIEEYCDMVLAASQYPNCFPKEWELEFNVETGILLVNYVLPAPDALPTTTEMRYVQSGDEFSERQLTDKQHAALYDDVLYQTTLRTIHELFEADQVSALVAIVFNGIVTAVDRGTGNAVTNCVLSVQASRVAFSAINLREVDPKACFRSLKGIGSSALHSVTAVAPIMTLRRDDGRFIAAKDVSGQLDAGYNLATMPWEDFEHLIRDVFEREFSAPGAEVKVTQASRDGGVDAVVFDPDPIRGGKMVIQAKRYANTVGVSAVRDLYGTVMNEGATKGILVTTSDYGPDAYEFVKAKPLTLLNGANLLHLLQKHGLNARIDLAEARAAAVRRP
jgi:restriction system protein